MTKNTQIVHIIANSEIGMTECGLMVDYHEVSDPTPWNLLSSKETAIWDDDVYPSNAHVCGACHNAYNN